MYKLLVLSVQVCCLPTPVFHGIGCCATAPTYLPSHLSASRTATGKTALINIVTKYAILTVAASIGQTFCITSLPKKFAFDR